ncbi:MAG: hypothetical protein WAT79_14235 [Saprospiraceae bacterium]
MKHLNHYLKIFLAITAISLVSCTKEDNCTLTCTVDEVLTNDCTCVKLNTSNIVKVTTNIMANTTWTKDKEYHLATRVTVVSGVTLTIQAGTVIKGEAGSGANATALLVARGGKLIANGTPTEPIVFTTVADKISSGQIESPNMDVNINGLWGGLIVLGKAPISGAGSAEAVQIEGIPASDINGLYGGTDVNDNSGELTYISIRHGGANIGDGNEINGLTLGGVGAGTKVENIEIISNQDDGIEIFGGSVNVKNVIVWNAGDDQVDCDQAWTGTLDNFICILGTDSDHGLELDGPEGSNIGAFTLKNGTLRGKGATNTTNGEYGDLRDKVACTIENVYFYDFSTSSDLELDNAGVSDNWSSGKIIFKNLEFNVSHLTSGNNTIESIFKDDGGRDAELNVAALGFAKLVSSRTTGADKSMFMGWTVSDKKGQLSGL